MNSIHLTRHGDNVPNSKFIKVYLIKSVDDNLDANNSTHYVFPLFDHIIDWDVFI